MPEHILQALLDDPDAIADSIIQATGGKLSRITEKLKEEMAKLPKVEGSGAGNLMIAPETARLFESAQSLARKAKDEFVTQERLLQAVVENGGTAAKVLTDNGVSAKALSAAITDMRGGRSASSAKLPRKPSAR